MKKFGKKVRTIGTALLLAGMASAYGATITNAASSYSPFGGFDWRSNGTAVVDGFNPVITVGQTDTFDLTFWASAVEIQDIFGLELLALTNLIPFEYTIRAVLNETATCTTFNGVICTVATFDVNSGSFEIWYDTTKDVNQVTGAGITDGISIITGTILAQAGGGFNVISGGNATLQATVDSTNSTYITPDLSSSTATTTLQIGGNITGWAAPTSMPGADGGTTPLPANAILLQADANQDFVAKVPEPSSIALAGLALLGLGLSRSRNKRA